jgi:hypothetical protein
MLADRLSDRLDANGSGEGDVTGDVPKALNLPLALFSGDHRKRLGRAVWLYLHLHVQCHTTGVEAGTSLRIYTHEEASRILGCSVPRIKRWMARLVAGGYVTTVPVNRGLVVTINGYVVQSAVEGPRDAC